MIVFDDLIALNQFGSCKKILPTYNSSPLLVNDDIGDRVDETISSFNALIFLPRKVSVSHFAINSKRFAFVACDSELAVPFGSQFELRKIQLLR